MNYEHCNDFSFSTTKLVINSATESKFSLWNGKMDELVFERGMLELTRFVEESLRETEDVVFVHIVTCIFQYFKIYLPSL